MTSSDFAEDYIDEQGQTMAEGIAKAYGISVQEVIQTVNTEYARRKNLQAIADCQRKDEPQ